MKRMFLVLSVMGLFLTLCVGAFYSKAQSEQVKGAMSGCEEQCVRCQTTCEKATAYIKKAGGKTASSQRLALLADCIAMCKTSAGFLGRDSQFHPKVCKLCADVCASCAKSCEELNDPKLKDCVEECKKCTESCNRMAE
jgi:hypothetical protein